MHAAEEEGSAHKTFEDSECDKNEQLNPKKEMWSMRKINIIALRNSSHKAMRYA